MVSRPAAVLRGARREETSERAEAPIVSSFHRTKQSASALLPGLDLHRSRVQREFQASAQRSRPSGENT
jgi:hypothetical protein